MHSRSIRYLLTNRFALTALIALTSCGGDKPTVTFVHQRTFVNGADSYIAIRSLVSAQGVIPTKLECGSISIDSRKQPGVIGPIYVDGDPQAVYFTFDGDSAELVRDLGWKAVVDDVWRNTYVDPFECASLLPQVE